MARVTLTQWAEDANMLGEDGRIDMENELLQEILMDSVQPAMCDEECEVEPDGHCPHGAPSLSIVLGII